MTPTTPHLISASQRAAITDQVILDSADKALCLKPSLQIAYDRMMLSNAEPGTDEYSHNWRAYLSAGGDRTMLDAGIDLENYKRLETS